MYGADLTKGVLIDMINNAKVYINGKSKYSFTDVSWNAKWIVDNLNSKEKIAEIGATDYIELHHLAKLINSSSEFEGEIDDQIILNESYKFNSSMKVLCFLEQKKMKYQKINYCRLCNSNRIKQLVNFGPICSSSTFPYKNIKYDKITPMIFGICNKCRLAQLVHNYNLKELYNDDYGYRSGINQAMVKHLTGITKDIKKISTN